MKCEPRDLDVSLQVPLKSGGETDIAGPCKSAMK